VLLHKHNINQDMRLIHYELAKLGGFCVGDKWWLHKPSPVVENSLIKILRDFITQTDRHLPHNRPDIVLYSYQHKTMFLIDVAVPEDSRLDAKGMIRLQILRLSRRECVLSLCH